MGNFQFRPLIALTTLTQIFSVLQWNCGKYWSFSPADVANHTNDLIALLFWSNYFLPVVEREPCKGVMRKSCHVGDTWWEKIGNF